MSITNIISNKEVTLVQGVNGLFIHEESWVAQSRKTALSKEASDKENPNNPIEKVHTNSSQKSNEAFNQVTATNIKTTGKQ